jgi:LPXTG-motif cell wall-anchored protein
VGQVVTITYSVLVTGAGDKSIANVVTSPDADGTCVPAPDQNPDCATKHHVDPGAAATTGGSSLASTGSDITGWVMGAVALIAAGLATVVVRRRRMS